MSPRSAQVTMYTYSLKNYRAFARSNPVSLSVGDGITFILGPNNVGKSCLLRTFHEFQAAFAQAVQDDNRRYHSQLGHNFEIATHRSSRESPIELVIKSDRTCWTVRLESTHSIHNKNALVTVEVEGESPSNEIRLAAFAPFRRPLYVPSYRSTTVNAQEALHGMAIGRQFVSLWDSWANGTRIDQSDQVRKLIDELGLLLGFKRFEIRVASDKSQLLIETEDGRFGLEEMGDGISHFIIVLGNAMIKQPDYILIDEPEIGLHPRMQEMFVRVLASKARHGLIATSHSIGLARSVGDRLFLMTKDSKGKRHLHPFGEHSRTTISQSISEMGFSQFAELGASHLLLVEGRTDIKAFREVLRKFGLDQHFLIWSLNGSDWVKSPPQKIVEELNEIKRLNASSISIIFDSERTDSSSDMSEAVRPFHDLCKDMGFNVFPTDRHSTENYVTQEALDKICPNCKALSEYEVFGTNGQRWDKSKNWLLFREMNKADIESTGLGLFISETLGKLVPLAPQKADET